MIGVHTPEFLFEHDIDLVREATRERDIDYPVAIDNQYAIWNAFDNHYWPALYFIDSDGVIVSQHFGEGEYLQSERVIQRALGVDRAPVAVDVEGRGVEAAADWDHLRSPETYLGAGRSEGFASPEGAVPEKGCTGSPSGWGSISGRSPGTGPSSRRRPPSTTPAGASPSVSRLATRIW